MIIYAIRRSFLLSLVTIFGVLTSAQSHAYSYNEDCEYIADMYLDFKEMEKPSNVKELCRAIDDQSKQMCMYSSATGLMYFHPDKNISLSELIADCNPSQEKVEHQCFDSLQFYFRKKFNRDEMLELCKGQTRDRLGYCLGEYIIGNGLSVTPDNSLKAAEKCEQDRLRYQRNHLKALEEKREQPQS